MPILFLRDELGEAALTAKTSHSKGYTELEGLYQEGRNLLLVPQQKIEQLNPNIFKGDVTALDQFMRLKKTLDRDVVFYLEELDKIHKKHAKFKGAPTTDSDYAKVFNLGNRYLDVNARIMAVVPAIADDIIKLIEPFLNADVQGASR